MSTVWVLANLYQGDLAFVKTGDDVVVQTDAYPESFHGKISYVSAALDPNTRTLQARIVVDNPGEKLKRDMYCTVTVTAGTIQNAISVPDAAVLRDDENQPFVFLAVGGGISFQHMPVDAYPDLSPPMVEIITQWPGHAAEEIERLVSLPTEGEMNGVPKMSVMRSISLYGLSDIILTFDEDTDNYFARQLVFQRLSEVTYPTGVTPTLAPLSSPSGLVYRYVLQSPDRTPQELKTYEDWVIEREYKQVPGVADDSGFGGTVMQYQVLLDPARLYAYHIPAPTVVQPLSAKNSNAGGGFYSQGGQFYYVRGLGLVHDTRDIGDVIVGTQNGVPVRIRDIGDVTIGGAPRLGEFGFNKKEDAVEGGIMMRRGEQTQNVLKGVEAKTQQLNEHILPNDIKGR